VLPDSRIFVAGHRGLVGSSILEELTARGFSNLIIRTREELDLRNQAETESFFSRERPEFVFLCAAKVGGILANSAFPADFIYDNLAIQTNVIHSAYRNGAEKLLFLGSSCIYPKFADQPIVEGALLSGPLEPTNQPYAVAKIAGIELCQAYARQYGFTAISLMPTNLYGPGDNFDPQNSHVLPGLIRRFHEAKRSGSPEVVVWGTGTPRREFLFVSDLADAAIHLMLHYSDPELINVGLGEDISIGELAEIISREVGFQGTLSFDTSKPDGTPRKLLDSSMLRSLGWEPKVSLEEGIRRTYGWYRANTA
jgi:GDP-L-fucose synthase